MWRGELHRCFQKVQSDSKKLGIISKLTLWYPKRKIWLKTKEPNLQHCFPRSMQAKRGRHYVYWRSKGYRSFAIILGYKLQCKGTKCNRSTSCGD
jgi:hypothetical protein